LKIISLFSGAGGLDLGLQNAGHKIVWANDIDEDAVDTYRLNIGNHIEHADITRLSARSLPDADAVVGGFPCQGFSQANMRRWEGDERNALFAQFVRILRAKEPRYFVAENVKGLLSLGGGSLLLRILGSFRRAGYRVEYRVLNAANYGVPQNRQRVIFLGTRNDIAKTRALTFPKPTHAKKDSSGAGQLKEWLTIGEALMAIPDVIEPHDFPNHVHSHYKVAYRNFTGHRKTDPDKPSPTILARGNGKGGVCAIPHPFWLRRMSVRESAWIQTFPLNFEFKGALNSMYRQVGNAVPVRLGEHLGRALKEATSNRST
jgi:DNA (cytosine-5)-methyltransferase 1